jgi:TolB protein
VSLAARSLALAGLAVLIALAAACSSDDPATPVPTDTPTAESDPTPTPSVAVEPGDQHIVYVTDDFTVFTIRQDGTGRKRILGGTGGVGVAAQPLVQDTQTAYTWPTWSPDGTRIAVSRAPGPTDGSLAALAVIDPPSGDESYLHVTARGGVNRVAPGLFHYAQWSPNSERLLFTAPNPRRTALSVFESRLDGAGPRRIVSNAQLYTIWSPDSLSQLIHRGEELFLRNVEANQSLSLRRPSLGYRVAAYAPNARSIAYVADIGAGPELVVRTLGSGDELALTEVPGEAAFAWSPVDSSMMAVISRTLNGPIPYDGLWLYDTETGEGRRAYSEDVLAFYWSPDGSKIVMASVHESRSTIAWIIIDLDVNETKELGVFVASADFLVHLQFFDQCGPSHPVWSEDSKHLVFSGQMPDLSSETHNQVWLVDTSGDAPPVALARGRQAYWVPSAATTSPQ